MAISISDKVDIRAKKITRERGKLYNDRRPKHMHAHTPRAEGEGERMLSGLHN